MEIKAKKSLGQNFLKDKEIINKIIMASDLNKNDVVLEIGPGKGILTEELAKNAKKILAVEVDSKLVEFLDNKFKDAENIEIIPGDILQLNLSEVFKSYDLDLTAYKLIANIPYYITSPIIRLFLEAENSPQEMILMVQKEVAERIVAKPGQMSILAVSVQYYADADLLFHVPKEAFDPAPEVDSAVIKITKNKEQEKKSREEVKKFFRVVKAGFSAKRKTLINNLSNSLHLGKKDVEVKLKTAGLSPTVRAQELSVEDWEKLVQIIKM